MPSRIVAASRRTGTTETGPATSGCRQVRQVVAGLGGVGPGLDLLAGDGPQDGLPVCWLAGIGAPGSRCDSTAPPSTKRQEAGQAGLSGTGGVRRLPKRVA